MQKTFVPGHQGSDVDAPAPAGPDRHPDADRTDVKAGVDPTTEFRNSESRARDPDVAAVDPPVLVRGGVVTKAGSSASPSIVAGAVPTSDIAVSGLPVAKPMVVTTTDGPPFISGPVWEIYSASVAGAVTSPAGTLRIDTTAPAVTSVAASGSGIDGGGNGNLNAGHVVTLTVNLSEAVTVAGGTPTLALNNGGTATYVIGSGSNVLGFSYTVAAGQDTADLTVTAFNPNGATLRDAAGNSASLAGAVTSPAGTLRIDTTAPAVTTVAASGSGIDGGGNGNLDAGHVVTLTVTMSEAVTVAGGTPTLALNNGGTASYTGGSGSNVLG